MRKWSRAHRENRQLFPVKARELTNGSEGNTARGGRENHRKVITH